MVSLTLSSGEQHEYCLDLLAISYYVTFTYSIAEPATPASKSDSRKARLAAGSGWREG
jgi:hypothetical protein